MVDRREEIRMLLQQCDAEHKLALARLRAEVESQESFLRTLMNFRNSCAAQGIQTSFLDGVLEHWDANIRSIQSSIEVLEDPDFMARLEANLHS